MNTVLPLLSSLTSFVFAGLVFDQWLKRRRSFQLVWSVGLLWYGISAGTEFWGSTFGWNEPLYKAWYLIGAMFVAAYLGAGTVFLLSRTRFGYFAATAILAGGLFALLLRNRYPGALQAAYLTFASAAVGGVSVAAVTRLWRSHTGKVTIALLIHFSVIAAFLVVKAHLAAPGWAVDPVTHVPVGTLMPGYIRLMTVPLNIAGALCLVFGAAYSAYVYMPKKRVLPARLAVLAVTVNFFASLPGAARSLVQGRLNSRVPATLLIALGGFIPGVTSGLNRFGVTWAFFLGELLGVLLILAGFLVSEEILWGVRRSPAAESGSSVPPAPSLPVRS